MNEHNVTMEGTLSLLLEGKKYASLRDVLSTMNPSDIAAVFAKMEEDRLPLLFRLLPKELAAETCVEMEPDSQEMLIKGFSDSELRDVLDELYIDDAVDIVEEMPANVVQRILSTAAPDMRKYSGMTLEELAWELHHKAGIVESLRMLKMSDDQIRAGLLEELSKRQ